MPLEKIAVKNQRPGVMVTPGLRPPDEDDPSREDERLATDTEILAEAGDHR